MPKPNPSAGPSALLAALETPRVLLNLAQTGLNRSLGRPLMRDVVASAGRPVIVAPGLGANHLLTGLLCHELRQHGFLVQDWGGGTNVGPKESIEAWIAPMVERIEAFFKETGRKVALVGWSLGGIAVREASRLQGLPVDRVITLATPFTNLEATNVGWAYKLLNDKPSWVTPKITAELAKEPPVAGASIYSRCDGVVAWEACIQPAARRTRNVEVTGAGHFGMVACPKVLKVVAQELAA